MKRNSFRLTSHLIRLSFIIIGLTGCLVILPSASSGPASPLPAAPPAAPMFAPPPAASPMAVSPATRTGFKLTGSSAVTGAPFVPNITATLADALQVDNNNSGKADPGDTLMYTVTITNSGTDATGVVFTDDLSQNGGNLTLVPLSMYFSDGRVKVELALARGKQAHDKRQDIAKRDAQREVTRELGRRAKGMF